MMFGPIHILFLTCLLFLHFAHARVTGQQYCNEYICLTGQHDDQRKLDTYTLSLPAGQTGDVGWMAMGFGETMVNSPMIIVWPNSDGSFTLSQRSATTYTMPQVVANPARRASLITSQSFSNSSSTSFTFTLPSDATTSNTTDIIWAFSAINPGSSATNADIRQHSAAGPATLALLASLDSNTNTNTSTNGNGNSNSNISTPTNGTSTSSNAVAGSNQHAVVVAHVVCGALATMLLLPVTMLIPRVRAFTDKRWWFPLHLSSAAFASLGMVYVAFVTAVSRFHGGIDSQHRKLGLAVFIVIHLQIALGIFTHWYKPVGKPRPTGRGISNWLHMILGPVLVGLGLATAWAGIDSEWARYAGNDPHVGWRVGWIIIMLIILTLYLSTLYFTFRNRNRNRTGNSNKGRTSTSYNQQSSSTTHLRNTSYDRQWSSTTHLRPISTKVVDPSHLQSHSYPQPMGANPSPEVARGAVRPDSVASPVLPRRLPPPLSPASSVA